MREKGIEDEGTPKINDIDLDSKTNFSHSVEVGSTVADFVREKNDKKKNLTTSGESNHERYLRQKRIIEEKRKEFEKYVTNESSYVLEYMADSNKNG